MSQRQSPQHESLLAQLGWVRELAGHLVRDTHLADELSQDAYLAYLQSPPSPEKPVRGWLARVLRNSAHEAHRRDHRRTARERSVSRPEQDPSPEELVERASTQTAVARAVLELPEPYRTTILLRFFEELPPRKIARRLGIPVATVKTRLSRGLEKLREHLDREHPGGRSAWLAACIPLIPTAGGWTATTTGIVTMKSKTSLLLLAVALLMLVTGGIWWSFAGPETPSDQDPNRSLASSGASDPDAKSSTSKRRGRKANTGPGTPPSETATTATEPTEEESATDVGPTVTFTGLVVDASSQPLEGVLLECQRRRTTDTSESEEGPKTPISAISDADGVFEMTVPEGQGQAIVSASDQYTTVLAGLFRGAPSSIEPVVVVAPRRPTAGVVLDPDGQAVPGARIWLTLPASFRSGLEPVLDSSFDMEWSTETGVDGHFALPDIPEIGKAQLEAFHPEYQPHREELPTVATADLEIVLKKAVADENSVTGVVIDPDGFPVPGAHVSHGIDSVLADDHGCFVFDLKNPESFNTRFRLEVFQLTAVKVGFTPGILRLEKSSDAWPEPIVLQLGDPPLPLAGRVFDEGGQPVKGARVWVDDPTFFGSMIGPRPRATHVEHMLAGASDRGWHYATTDEDGHFRIEGLLHRDYRLRAMDPQTLLMTDSEPVPAGTLDLEIQFPEEAYHQRLAGRVVSRSGDPLPGISIFPMCDTFRTKYEGRVIGTRHEGLDAIQTDENGRFEFERVPRNLVYLRLNGDSIISFEPGRREGLAKIIGPDPEDFEIVAPLRIHVKVELRTPEMADQVAILDEKDEPITINVIMGGSRRETPRVPIHEGVTDVLAVTDAAVTLVLYKEDEEVRRERLTLLPGEVNLVRP